MNSNWAYDPDQPVQAEYHEYVLEKIRVQFQQRISETYLMDAKLEQWYDHMLNQIVYQVKGYVWGENVKTYEYQWPKDWWHAFKERWVTRRMFGVLAEPILKRWPVEYVRRKVDVKALYPEFRVSAPHETHRFIAQESWDW